MYEFTNKEIRKDFRKTEYGKKVNMYIIVGYVLFFVTLLTSVLVTILANQNFFEVIYSFKTGMTPIQRITIVSYTLCAVATIMLVYFDGKRDGAITEYRVKKINKKEV